MSLLLWIILICFCPWLLLIPAVAVGGLIVHWKRVLAASAALLLLTLLAKGVESRLDRREADRWERIARTQPPAAASRALCGRGSTIMRDQIGGLACISDPQVQAATDLGYVRP